MKKKLELKGILNLLHGSRDEKDGIFELEFSDSNSHKVISIKISRQEMAEIFFGGVHRRKENCTITIPENIGKKRVQETHRVKTAQYTGLKESDVRKYFEEKGMVYEDWEWYEQRSQSSIRYGKNGEPDEREILIIKYV